MLQRIGLHGYESIETPILAGLVTGDPVLLVGGHGAAKTLLCRRLARAMNLEFWAYDASKAMFEDVLGFPNPASLSQGRIEYTPTPISIWDKEFVLIDELSRATPSMQSKWLEVVRSRQVMGCKLPRLQHVFAAMNPPSYLGAHPLDEALASRFAVTARVPDAWEMDEQTLDRVITEQSEDDAPALAASPSFDAATGDELHRLIQEARACVARSPKAMARRLRIYVAEVGRFLASRNWPLDGRRLGMMWRTLQACLAIHALREGDGRLRFNESAASLQAALPCVLPFDAEENAPSALLLRAAHEHAWAAAKGRRRAALANLPRDPLEAVGQFEARHRSATPPERQAAITSFLSKAKAPAAADARGRSLAAVLRLARGVCAGALHLSVDDQYRVLESYLSLTYADIESVVALCQEINLDPESFRVAGLLYRRDLSALRAAFLALQGDSQRSPDAAEIVELAHALACALDECRVWARKEKE